MRCCAHRSKGILPCRCRYADAGRQACGIGELGQNVKVWDLERGEVLRTLEGHSEGVAALR